MSKKKISAPFYTKIRLGISSLFNDTRLPNGCLYANGRNRTKIKPEDLPDTYLPLMVYKVDGYIRLDGIKDVVYKPNYHINHMHKDDFLYISYSTAIQSEVDQHGFTRYYDYDALLWGGNISHFIRAIRKHGGFDIEPIAAEVIKKELFFLEKYPEERRNVGSSYMLITQEEYENVIAGAQMPNVAED